MDSMNRYDIGIVPEGDHYEPKWIRDYFNKVERKRTHKDEHPMFTTKGFDFDMNLGNHMEMK